MLRCLRTCSRHENQLSRHTDSISLGLFDLPVLWKQPEKKRLLIGTEEGSVSVMINTKV